MLEQSFTSYNAIKIWCTVTSICLMKCQILFLEKKLEKNILSLVSATSFSNYLSHIEIMIGSVK